MSQMEDGMTGIFGAIIGDIVARNTKPIQSKPSISRCSPMVADSPTTR